MTKLILHIGAPKTGTTSIQAYLGNHYEALLQKGVLYPRLGCDEAIFHHVFTRPMKAEAPFDGIWSVEPVDRLKTADEIAAALRQEIADTGARTVIVSSEVFYCLSSGVFFAPHEGIDVAAETARFFADFDVEVIAYFRRQDKWLESCYIEAVKGPHTLASEPIEDFDLYTDTDKLDYMKQIEPWERAFGAERVTVRSFDAAIKGPGIIEAFLADIALTRDAIAPAADEESYFENVSPSAAGVELIRRLNRRHAETGENDPRLLPRFSQLNTAFTAVKKARFLSPERCRALLEAVAERNAEFADKYGLADFASLAADFDPDAAWPVVGAFGEDALVDLIDLLQHGRVEVEDDLDALYRTAEERLAEVTRVGGERDELFKVAEERLVEMYRLVDLADERAARITALEAEKADLARQLDKWRTKPLATWYKERRKKSRK